MARFWDTTFKRITMKLHFIYFTVFVLMHCSAQKELVEIHVEQESDLYHKALKINIAGLPINKRTFLTLKATDAKKHLWLSTAIYQSNQLGAIDITQDKSLGGSYEGIYPMGLFWSLKSNDYHQIATNQGFNAKLTVEVDNKIIASKNIYRRSTRELEELQIKKIKLRDNLVANYYQPISQDNKPNSAIIFLGGSGGNFREERASLFASEGIAVLDLKYFKGPGLKDGIIEIPLEYVHSAHQWLANRPEIEKDNIGITGRSRGSELALLYATKYDIKYVIAEVPSSVVWFGWEDGKSSWTYQGKPFNYAEYTAEDSERIEQEMNIKGVQYHDGPKFLSAFKNTDLIKSSAIPVEDINCPILFISGEDDKVWPSTMMANQMMSRLKESGFAHEYKHLIYKNAGHNFAGGGQGCGIPYLPAEDYSNSSARGGTDKGNAIAAIDSWDKILLFINRYSNPN
ncbi:MAG: acyl-CoA thioesterase/bile acid-CoA:amino acid N-acyltransferase family protein [Bacteroidota bacterium]